jgi:dUTP pyrophosphatase
VKTKVVKFKRLHRDAVIPSYAHGPAEDAGMDLVAVEDKLLMYGQPEFVSTGLAIELPAGVEGQIRPRSGLATKHGIFIPNSPGTVDPGYRGEVKVCLLKLAGAEPYQVKKGERIAQLVLNEYVAANPKEAEESGRGEAGFGSTGK